MPLAFLKQRILLCMKLWSQPTETYLKIKKFFHPQFLSSSDLSPNINQFQAIILFLYSIYRENILNLGFHVFAGL